MCLGYPATSSNSDASRFPGRLSPSEHAEHENQIRRCTSSRSPTQTPTILPVCAAFSATWHPFGDILKTKAPRHDGAPDLKGTQDMRKRSELAPEVAHTDGRTLPLAFAYGDVAFYYDVNEYKDDRTTVERKDNGEIIEGIAASQDLVSTIRQYGRNRGKVVISRFFNDLVANEIALMVSEDSETPDAADVPGNAPDATTSDAPSSNVPVNDAPANDEEGNDRC